MYQVMPITDEMHQVIMRNGNALDIADQAQKEGVRDLRQSGLLKVKSRNDMAGNRGDHRTSSAQSEHGHRNRRRPPRCQGIHLIWEGTNHSDRQVRGESKAASETVVVTNLRRQGIRVAKIKRQTFRGGKKVTDKDIAFFTRQLATMLRARACLCSRPSRSWHAGTATRASRGS